MPRLSWITVALAALLALTACENTFNDDGGVGGMSRSETIGTGGGAVAGGLAGYLLTDNAAGALIGAAAGGLVGNRIGNYLEGDDETAAAKAAARAAELPADRRVTWERSGATFQTAAKGWASAVGEPYQDDNGRTCRRVHQEVTKGDTALEDTVILCKGTKGWVPA